MVLRRSIEQLEPGLTIIDGDRERLSRLSSGERRQMTAQGRLVQSRSSISRRTLGFYYAASAAGRLIGILLSGALAQYGGLSACLWGSAAMLAICLLLTFLLPAGSEARRMVAAG
jgi:Tfp pilus assembly PilM family ATPase